MSIRGHTKITDTETGWSGFTRFILAPYKKNGAVIRKESVHEKV